ncbi:MAG: hypothetical protein KDD66_10705 [Bdellovibrionales bacterium]|nr:hypothetical protein [Bdellovibrionales bacterium]
MVERIEQSLPRRSRLNVETALASALFLALLIQVGLRIHLVGKGYEVAAVQNELLEYDAELRQLRADYASLHRPARLKQIAKSHGLSAMGEGQIRYIEERRGL